jgi:hypothetical protein
MQALALALLRQMFGPDADFRAGQWEAIETLVAHRKRALVVQRTGWGKSIVYFLAAKLLRGVDQWAMAAALAEEGQAVGILADSLERTIRGPDVRGHVGNECLTLLTPFSPGAGFSVGNAMARNKLIYALADYALVVASDAEKGGTWAGATEALQQKWAPVFVCAGDDFPKGNQLLEKRGARPLPWPFPGKPVSLLAWMEEHAARPERQGQLF